MHMLHLPLSGREGSEVSIVHIQLGEEGPGVSVSVRFAGYSG